jgi:hypothetical protein
MAKTQGPLKVAGYPVERATVGSHTLGVVTIDDSITVMFRVSGSGSGGGGSGGDCLACKISKISECAKEVCPDIKANEPEASCSDAIQACAARKCSDRCGGGLGAFGGGMIVIA